MKQAETQELKARLEGALDVVDNAALFELFPEQANTIQALLTAVLKDIPDKVDEYTPEEIWACHAHGGGYWGDETTIGTTKYVRAGSLAQKISGEIE